MRGLQRLSLRFKIAGSVLAGLVVLLSFFGFLALRTINLSTDVAFEERLRLAQISAESVDELLMHTARQLERTAAHVSTGATAEEQRRQVAQVYDLLGEFDRIVHLSPEGEVLWIVPQRTDDVGWRFADEAAVQAALGRAETSIIGPAQRMPADRPIAILIAPLDQGDRSAGFLAGEVRAVHAGVSLLPLPHGEGSVRSEIVDAGGYIVAQSGDGETDPNEHVDTLGPLIASGRPGTKIHHVENGADHVLAYYPFRSLPGGVVVEQTQDAALVIPREMERTMLVYGIGALLIASGVAWLHAHSVMRPIRRLTEDAARMASGDLESPIRISRGDEIGELGRRFDEMRVQLKASLEESARWAEELERRVRERTSEVEERNRELDALTRMRRQLLAKTITAQEDERKRLARELHDDSAQILTAVLMTLKTAEDALPSSPQDAREALKRSRAQLAVALREIRKAILDLRPSALDDLGLASAVRWYADEHLRPLHIKVALEIDGDEKRATGAAATAIFRIVQEAVNNIARHSGAASTRIGLKFGRSAVTVLVEDDGRGFDPDSLRQPHESGRGLGLLGMRERAGLFGGTVEIESGAGKGTRVRVRIPYA